jgi:hypothetical protein
MAIKVKKRRNLIKTKSKRVTKENVCWEHIRAHTLESLHHLEYLEEHNDEQRLKKTIRLFEQFEKLVSFMKERLKNDLDHLEYLRITNREKQSRMSESQLKALFKNEATRQLKRDGVPYNEENLKIQLNHMVQAYYEREAERHGDNEEAKKALKERIQDFNPENLEFDVDSPE